MLAPLSTLADPLKRRQGEGTGIKRAVGDFRANEGCRADETKTDECSTLFLRQGMRSTGSAHRRYTVHTHMAHGVQTISAAKSLHSHGHVVQKQSTDVVSFYGVHMNGYNQKLANYLGLLGLQDLRNDFSKMHGFSPHCRRCRGGKWD